MIQPIHWCIQQSSTILQLTLAHSTALTTGSTFRSGSGLRQTTRIVDYIRPISIDNVAHCSYAINTKRTTTRAYSFFSSSSSLPLLPSPSPLQTLTYTKTLHNGFATNQQGESIGNFVLVGLERSGGMYHRSCDKRRGAFANNWYIAGVIPSKSQPIPTRLQERWIRST